MEGDFFFLSVKRLEKAEISKLNTIPGCRRGQLVSRCFEPSQPLGILSRLRHTKLHYVPLVAPVSQRSLYVCSTRRRVGSGGTN